MNAGPPLAGLSSAESKQNLSSLFKNVHKKTNAEVFPPSCVFLSSGVDSFQGARRQMFWILAGLFPPQQLQLAVVQLLALLPRCLFSISSLRLRLSHYLQLNMQNGFWRPSHLPQFLMCSRISYAAFPITAHVVKTVPTFMAIFRPTNYLFYF